MYRAKVDMADSAHHGINSANLLIHCANAVDVFNIDSGTIERVDTDPFVPGTQSIPVPNVTVLMDYFRP